MSATILALLKDLIPGLFISVLTALVTVRLSIRQFRSERWWEKKWDAYSQIMKQLTLLEFSYGSWYDDAVSARALNDESKAILREQHHQAEESIGMAAAAGSFVVSKESARVLADLVKEFDKHAAGEHWVDEIGRHYQSTVTSIARIREHAKADLR
jgi:hypothetical protein